MFGDCDMDTKKMIVSCVIKAVRVRRNYEVEIDMTLAAEELGICLDETENTENAEQIA